MFRKHRAPNGALRRFDECFRRLETGRVRKHGGVIGCRQFRVAVMLYGGESRGVVGCLALRIARHTGPDGIYRAEEADKAARAVRRRPKKRLLDCDEILRRRVIADLSQGHTPLHGYFSRRSQRDQPRGNLHVVR